MLRAACVGLWLALSASFAVSAGIIGMPLGVILLEIVRTTLWVALAVGLIVLARMLVQEWRRSGNKESSV